ncbi:hypothetical protein F5B18DRAFT_126396 [Nemania serpens]|nr:hypothetical protein F5B18DRAFT_126396 [Nemania serpens]
MPTRAGILANPGPCTCLFLLSIIPRSQLTCYSIARRQHEPPNPRTSVSAAFAATRSLPSHQFVDTFLAIQQPGPDSRLIYTARIVPNSVLAKQLEMDAELQSDDPSRRPESSNN